MEGRCGAEEAEQSVCFPSRKEPILESASAILLCLEGLCRRRKGEREPSFKFPRGQFRLCRSVTHLQTLSPLDPRRPHAPCALPPTLLDGATPTPIPSGACT